VGGASCTVHSQQSSVTTYLRNAGIKRPHADTTDTTSNRNPFIITNDNNAAKNTEIITTLGKMNNTMTILADSLQYQVCPPNDNIKKIQHCMDDLENTIWQIHATILAHATTNTPEHQPSDNNLIATMTPMLLRRHTKVEYWKTHCQAAEDKLRYYNTDVPPSAVVPATPTSAPKPWMGIPAAQILFLTAIATTTKPALNPATQPGNHALTLRKS
jgi:hypothetical protein